MKKGTARSGREANKESKKTEGTSEGKELKN
jgi:hypothetical protein